MAATHLIFKTGSEGEFSTTLCQSRYGLKDTIGNLAEWAVDQAACDPNLNCSFESGGLDLKTRSNYFNPSDSTYLTFNAADNGDNFGIPLDTITSGTSILGDWIHTAVYGGIFTKNVSRFFTPILGLPLSCEGSACNHKLDDNLRVSTKAASAVPEASVPSFNIRNDNFLIGKIAEFGTAGIVSGGFPTYGAHSSNIHAERRGGDEAGVYSGAFIPPMTMNNMVGGRCAIKLNENENGAFKATSSSTLFE